MFYVSSCKGNLIGVTDTKDDVEEFYTKEQLEAFNVDIIRFNKELPLGYKFETECFEFELIEIDNTTGWKLKHKEDNNAFSNKPYYLGYPVISLEKCFASYNQETIDVSGMDTSNVTNMNGMFRECKSLTTLDLRNFNTSNVTNMEFMFCRCNSLTTLDLRNFNTSNVTDMEFMFYGCKSLTTLDLNSFKTSRITNMSDMFYKCCSLTTLDLSSFNTSKVTNMSDMFNECKSLTTLDLSNFNTSNVKNMYSMFKKCHSLTTLDLSNFNTSNVIDMDCMFLNCNSITTLDLSSFDTSNVTGMDNIFSNSNIRLVKCNSYRVIKQAPSIGLIEASKCETYDKKIKVKRGTKFKHIASKLCLLIDKGVIAYEEID